jgi:hypothetical protein
MMGSERNGEGQDGVSVSGIIPESLVDIFDCVRGRRQAAQAQQAREEWRVFASFLEVRSHIHCAKLFAGLGMLSEFDPREYLPKLSWGWCYVCRCTTSRSMTWWRGVGCRWP